MHYPPNTQAAHKLVHPHDPHSGSQTVPLGPFYKAGRGHTGETGELERRTGELEPPLSCGNGSWGAAAPFPPPRPDSNGRSEEVPRMHAVIPKGPKSTFGGTLCQALILQSVFRVPSNREPTFLLCLLILISLLTLNLPPPHRRYVMSGWLAHTHGHQGHVLPHPKPRG